MKTVEQRIMELAYMVADGKISQGDADKMLAEEDEARLLYDDPDDWISCRPDQNPSVF